MRCSWLCVYSTIAKSSKYIYIHISSLSEHEIFVTDPGTIRNMCVLFQCQQHQRRGGFLHWKARGWWMNGEASRLSCTSHEHRQEGVTSGDSYWCLGTHGEVFEAEVTFGCLYLSERLIGSNGVCLCGNGGKQANASTSCFTRRTVESNAGVRVRHQHQSWVDSCRCYMQSQT